MQGKSTKILTLTAALLIASLACSLSAQPPGPPPGAVLAETDSTPNPTSTVSRVETETVTPTLQSATLSPVETVETVETDVSFPTETSTPEPESSATETSEPTITQSPVPTETAAVTASSPPTNPAFISPLDTATLKLTDSFNGGGTFVTANIEGSYSINYTDETFQFKILESDLDAWVIRSQVVDNVRQEIDIVAGEGPGDGFFGLLCRWERSSTYYRFTASLDGEVKITKYYLNIVTDLAQAQSEEYVPTQGQPLRMRADCSNTNLYLYLNEKLILSAEDNEISIGNVGLMAGSSSSAPVTIEVDNYALYYR